MIDNIIRFAIECSKCHGLGKIPGTNEHCYICDGEGVVERTVTKKENKSDKDTEQD